MLPFLKDINVSKNESSRLQKIADIPDKSSNLLHLQDAYKQIETIEAQAKMTLETITGICFDDCTEINNAMTFFIAPRKRRSGMIASFYPCLDIHFQKNLL